MKYEFKTVGLDDFILEYEAEENGIREVKRIPFKRTVQIAKTLQSINAEARAKLYGFLTSIGKTKSDFVIKVSNPDGTIVYDETNYRELEEMYIKEASAIAVNNIVIDTLGISLDKLLKELRIDDDEVQKAEIFAKKFFSILKSVGEKEDTFPRGNSPEPLSTSSSETEQNDI